MHTESLEELFTRVKPRLKSIVARYKVPAQDAEDLIQTSLTATLRNWESLNDPEGWLIRTVVNQCLMYWRSRRRRPELPLDSGPLEHLSPPVPSPEARIVNRELVEMQLAQLPPLCRQLFSLRFLYGFSASEIAAILGRRVSSIYGATHRCMKLRQELTGADPPEDV